jgi:hypothetical protein
MSITILPHYTDEEIIEMISDVIGQPYTEAVRADVKARTLRPTRPYGPGHIGTRDLRPDRINLEVNDLQMIVGIHFG